MISILLSISVTMVTAKGRTRKIYKCEFCGQISPDNWKLQKHRRMHTGERPFVCDYCGKGFTAKYTLKAHMAIHLLPK